MNPFDLTGRVAIVTGGNGGIGHGMASALLAAGARVAIWGSKPDKTESARASLAAACGDAERVQAFVCDVGDEAQVDATFAAFGQSIAKSLGALGTAVNEHDPGTFLGEQQGRRHAVAHALAARRRTRHHCHLALQPSGHVYSPPR